MARARQILFRIFYSTSFTAVFLLLVSFICVSLADAIYQSYKRNRLIDIFLLAGAYVIAALVAIFLYASRIYTNRSVLKDIPKTFMPIEREDLPGRRVKRLIDEGLARSAVVAYQAKPRSRRIEEELPTAGERILALSKSKDEARLRPRWGIVAHPGWSSPASKELPNLEYENVVDELVDLVEAKAVSLAPVDELETPSPDGVRLPDQRVVEVLTRPDAVGMRQYLTRLIELGMLANDELNVAFLSAYERARFGGLPLTEPSFQMLMRLFAELLRTMRPIDADMLEFSVYGDEPEHLTAGTSSSDKSTFSESGSVGHLRAPDNHHPRRMSEDSVPSMSEDDLDFQSMPTPTKSKSRSVSRPSMGSRMASRTSRPSLPQMRSNVSVHSSRSSRSNGSVIRLAREGDGHEFPYTIHVSTMETS